MITNLQQMCVCSKRSISCTDTHDQTERTCNSAGTAERRPKTTGKSPPPSNGKISPRKQVCFLALNLPVDFSQTVYVEFIEFVKFIAPRSERATESCDSLPDRTIAYPDKNAKPRFLRTINSVHIILQCDLVSPESMRIICREPRFCVEC